MDCWYKEVCSEAKDGCETLCNRFVEMRFLMTHSNLPANKQQPIKLVAPQVDIAAFKKLSEIKADIVNFVKGGKQLYISSKITGNGKTSWSIKLMHAYFDKCWYGNGLQVRALYIPVSWFLLRSKEFRKVDPEFDELKENLMKADLVVWDDIGCTNVSSYDITTMLMYIDHRINSGLSNIFTGNITEQADMDRLLGQRISGRILSHNTIKITFMGGSMR